MRVEQGAAALRWSADFCGGAWVLSDYREVAAALRDPRFSVRRAARWINSSITLSPPQTPLSKALMTLEKDRLRCFKRLLSRSLLFIDGRAHSRLRRLMQAGFNAGALQQQRPRIAAIIDTLLQRLLARPGVTAPDGSRLIRFDLIADFARPLPALVIADLLGIGVTTTDGYTDFIDAAAAIAAFIGSPTPTQVQAEQAQAALQQMAAYFDAVIARRRQQKDRAPATDLLASLIAAERDARLSATELLAQCCTLLFAGYETTRHLLGNGVLTLLQHPRQWQILQADPTLLPLALRELLRLDSPVQYTGRRLTEDLMLHGRQLRRGDLVILHLGAANRDSHRFSNPDQLDIGRDEGNHLAFGSGPHVCIGATLTYLEAELALAALMRALPGLALDSAAPPQRQQYAAYRGLESLPLQCRLPARQPFTSHPAEVAHG